MHHCLYGISWEIHLIRDIRGIQDEIEILRTLSELKKKKKRVLSLFALDLIVPELPPAPGTGSSHRIDSERAAARYGQDSSNPNLNFRHCGFVKLLENSLKEPCHPVGADHF